MPVTRITKSLIDSLPYTESGQLIYMDKDLPGFGCIIGTRSKTFIAQKDIRGRSVRFTIGRYGHFTPDEARRIAKDKLYVMAQGINPNALEAKERANAITVETVLESYLSTRRNLSPRSKIDYRYNVNKYLPDWRNKLMTEITKDMISVRHAEIAEKAGPVTANKVMRVLRALYNHADATFDICPINPVMYLTKAKGWYKETRRRTYIKPHELKAWWDAVHALENDTYRDFFLLLLFTGLRRSEAASLKWTDIDFKDRTFTIPETKNGDPLVLPLSEYLFGILQERQKIYGNYKFVFPGPGETGHLIEPKKGVSTVIKSSGVHFSCHDLRRTFITIAESLEISHYSLKRLINHRASDVTAGYIIVSVDRLRNPVEEIARYIDLCRK